MKKYRVYGYTTVTVTVEVNAENEVGAYIEATNQLTELSGYAGNGGCNRLVGVDGEGQSIEADMEITYDDIEEIGEVDE